MPPGRIGAAAPSARLHAGVSLHLVQKYPPFKRGACPPPSPPPLHVREPRPCPNPGVPRSSPDRRSRIRLLGDGGGPRGSARLVLRCEATCEEDGAGTTAGFFSLNPLIWPLTGPNGEEPTDSASGGAGQLMEEVDWMRLLSIQPKQTSVLLGRVTSISSGKTAATTASREMLASMS